MNHDVTQRVDFECVYVANGEINAHRYRVEVTASCPQRSADGGVILDFKKFKKYIESVVPDKHYIYSSCSTLESADGFVIGNAFRNCGYPVMSYEFELSCENLCSYLADKLQRIFNVNEPGMIVNKLVLRETSDSFASWCM